MFFCEPCRRARRWPESIAKSYGTCELCGHRTTCHDVPSKHLPDPTPPAPAPKMAETRIKWSDIVKAARETAEALDGKDWVNAGIKAKNILFDLADEHERLEAAIRNHRDQKGDNRCWQDDDDLYAALPEGATVKADTSLPPESEFLESCARHCRQFWRNRQRPEDRDRTLATREMTITQLEAEIGRLTGELNRLYRIVVSDPAHTREEVVALGNRTAEATRAIDVWNSRLNLETKIMENRELRAEVERLQAEVERLESAARAAAYPAGERRTS